MNLYEELIDKLEEFDKTIEDIVWVGSSDYEIPIDSFLELAKETEYNQGFGAAEIAQDLIIAGVDWWLERVSDDGAEWFELKTMPTHPLRKKQVFCLNTGKIDEVGWMTLKDINDKFLERKKQQKQIENNKFQQALDYFLEHLKDLGYDTSKDDEYCKHYNNLTLAVQKATPQKVKVVSEYGGYNFVCPYCGESLFTDLWTGYCVNCGQKLEKVEGYYEE